MFSCTCPPFCKRRPKRSVDNVFSLSTAGTRQQCVFLSVCRNSYLIRNVIYIERNYSRDVAPCISVAMFSVGLMVFFRLENQWVVVIAILRDNYKRSVWCNDGSIRNFRFSFLPGCSTLKNVGENWWVIKIKRGTCNNIAFSSGSYTPP